MPNNSLVYQDKYCHVRVEDEPGAGGAYHEYSIWTHENQKIAQISFQNGPILEEGVNGLFNEHLIAICMHRLSCFQKGPFPHEANLHAMRSLQSALVTLGNRTREREKRGVEGKSIA